MPLVNCILVGDYDETGTRCSFYVPAPVNLSALQDLFPFEGNFHFRLKVSGICVGDSCEYVWFDITSKSEKYLAQWLTGDSVDIQALILSLPDAVVSDADYDDYFNEVDEKVMRCERLDRLPCEDKIMKKNSLKRVAAAKGKQILRSITHGVKTGAKSIASNSQTISLETVAKGASSFWNTMKQTASQLQNTLTGGQPLSDESEEMLAQLSESVSTVFTDANPQHVVSLSELWKALFPSQGLFQRRSDVWKQAGFQKPDPVTDLKATGLLALQSMTYLALTYTELTQKMLKDNKANTKDKYPFAIVGINLTLLLSELLNLREQRYLSVSANYWGIFEEKSSFFELFCICFVHMDGMWVNRKATRSDFAKLIGEVKTLVMQVLNRGPKNLEDLRYIAADEGMLLP